MMYENVLTLSCLSGHLVSSEPWLFRSPSPFTAQECSRSILAVSSLFSVTDNVFVGLLLEHSAANEVLYVRLIFLQVLYVG